MTAPAAPSAALPVPTPRRETSTLLLYIIGALLLAVAVAWVALSQREPASLPSASELASLQVATPAPAADVTRELALAELALQAGQLLEPPGQSALDFYRAALRADPANAAAQTGMAGLALRLEARARDTLAANRFAELDPLLNALREADSGGAYVALQSDIDERVAQRIQQIDAATRRGQLGRARALLEQVIAAPGVDLGAVATRLALVDEAQARLASGDTAVAGNASAASAQTDAAPSALEQRQAELRSVNDEPAVASDSALAPLPGGARQTTDPVDLSARSAAGALPPDALQGNWPGDGDVFADASAARLSARTAVPVNKADSAVADALAPPPGTEIVTSQIAVAQAAPGTATTGDTVAAPPQADPLRTNHSAAAIVDTGSFARTETPASKANSAAADALAPPPGTEPVASEVAVARVAPGAPGVARLTLPPAALAAADAKPAASRAAATRGDAASSNGTVRAAAAEEASVPALVITPLSGPGAGERAPEGSDGFATDAGSGIAARAAFEVGADDAVPPSTGADLAPVATLTVVPPTGDLPAAATSPGADEVAARTRPALPEPPRDTRLIDALELARARLSSGALIAPEYDSALFHFRQARALAPDNAQVAAGMETIFRSLTIRAIGAAAIADWDTADRLLDAAARLDGDLNAVVQAREQVLERRIAVESGTVLPMAELTRVELEAPRYPTRALHAAVEGWAMVEFTVAIDGTTTDIEVVGTSDRYGEQFARSAVQAIEEWTFEARVFRGRKIPQRTSTRLTFDLDR